MASDPLALGSLFFSILTFAMGTAVSIVLYRLGRTLDFRSRMRRADELASTLNTLFAEVQTELHDVIVINAKRYERDYDGGNDANRHGYVMTKGELLGPRHNGVELICRVVETWTDRAGKRTARKPRRLVGAWTKSENVYEVGLVPWEYIEHINLHGDEYRNEVLIYAQFRGPGKSPYRSYRYAEGDGRRIGPSGRLYFDPVDELGEIRPNRVKAWFKFQRARLHDRAMRRTIRSFS